MLLTIATLENWEDTVEKHILTLESTEQDVFKSRIPLNLLLVKESIESHISCSKDGQKAELKSLNKDLALVEKQSAVFKNV
jgi:hypothetical protein